MTTIKCSVLTNYQTRSYSQITGILFIYAQELPVSKAVEDMVQNILEKVEGEQGAINPLKRKLNMEEPQLICSPLKPPEEPSVRDETGVTSTAEKGTIHLSETKILSCIT